MFVVTISTLHSPDVKLIVARCASKAECARVMRLFSGKGWTIDRRPGLNTFGEIALGFHQESTLS